MMDIASELPFQTGLFYTGTVLKSRIPGVKCTIHLTVVLSSLSPTYHSKPSHAIRESSPLNLEK